MLKRHFRWFYTAIRISASKLLELVFYSLIWHRILCLLSAATTTIVWIVAYQVRLFIPNTKSFQIRSDVKLYSNYVRVPDRNLLRVIRWVYFYNAQHWFYFGGEAQEHLLLSVCLGVGMPSIPSISSLEAPISFLDYEYVGSQRYSGGVIQSLSHTPYIKIRYLPLLRISRARLQSPNYWILPISWIARKV